MQVEAKRDSRVETFAERVQSRLRTGRESASKTLPPSRRRLQSSGVGTDAGSLKAGPG